MNTFTLLAQLPEPNESRTYHARFTALVFVVFDRQTQVLLTVSDLSNNNNFNSRFNNSVRFGSFDEGPVPSQLVQVMAFPSKWLRFLDQYKRATGSHLMLNERRTNVAKYALFVEICAKVKTYDGSIECLISDGDSSASIDLIDPRLGDILLKERRLAYMSILKGTPVQFLQATKHSFSRVFGAQLFDEMLHRLDLGMSIDSLLGDDNKEPANDAQLETNDMTHSSPPILPSDHIHADDFAKSDCEPIEMDHMDMEPLDPPMADELDYTQSYKGVVDTQTPCDEDVVPTVPTVHSVPSVPAIPTPSGESPNRTITGYLIDISGLDHICFKSIDTFKLILGQLTFQVVTTLDKITYQEEDVDRIDIAGEELYDFVQMTEIEEVYTRAPEIKSKLMALISRKLSLKVRLRELDLGGGVYLHVWKLDGVHLDQLLS